MQDAARELSLQLPLEATIKQQKEISSKLVVRPLAEIIGTQAYGRFNRGNAESKISDKVFVPFFTPEASGREYYQEGDTLVVKEDIPGSKIYAMAVFVKSDIEGQGIKNPLTVTFRKGESAGNVEYLKVKNFCLVKEDEQAIDLAEAWYSQPANKDEKRRIGLLPLKKQKPPQSQSDAIVRTNSILLTDTQDDASYQMRDALGIKDTPLLSRWLGTILAGVKSTQKEEDLSNITQDRIPDPTKLTTEEGFTEQSERTRKSANVLEDTLATIRIRAVTNRLSAAERILYSVITSLSNQQRKGFSELVRFERNSMASALYLVRQLRQIGFDLFPGISNERLIQTVESTLKAYDKLYPKASQYGIQFASLMDVSVFVDSMKEEYDARRSQPDFNEDQFVEEFFRKYAQLQRDNRARLTGHKI